MRLNYNLRSLTILNAVWTSLFTIILIFEMVDCVCARERWRENKMRNSLIAFYAEDIFNKLVMPQQNNIVRELFSVLLLNLILPHF